MGKNREYYISKIEIGNIVAFKIGDSMFSGKVVDSCNSEHGVYTIRTKNNSVYFVHEENIVWVKNGTHWPLGIYNALKVSKERKE